MDKTEHLASLVIESAQVFIEKRMTPIVEGLAALKREASAFLTRDDAAKLIPDGSAAVRRMAEMSDEITLLRAELAARPSMEMMRSEQANAATKAAAELFAGLRIPKDGTSVTVDDVRPLLEQMVAALPKAKDGNDGKSVTVEDIQPVLDRSVQSEVGKAIAAIPAPEPGRPGKDADLALLNELVTMSVKAAMADIPRPKDGDPGKDAEPVDMKAVDASIDSHVAYALAQWERPKDGADGLGFDDLSVELKEDGRTIVLRFTRGERTKLYEIVVPWQIYRGVYTPGKRYQRGDNVTRNGCQWTCLADTTTAPPSADWLQSTKAGRDGHDK